MSSQNGIFDEIAAKKPRRVVTIRYSSDTPILVAVAACIGVLLFLVIVATLTDSFGNSCRCGSCGSRGGGGGGGKNQTDDDSTLTMNDSSSTTGSSSNQERQRRFFATDLPPSKTMMHQVDEIKRALRSVHNGVRDIETRLARDEQMLLNTSNNVAKLNELRAARSVDASETDPVPDDHLDFVERGKEAFDDHVDQLHASERMLDDLQTAIANTNDGETAPSLT